MTTERKVRAELDNGTCAKKRKCLPSYSLSFHSEPNANNPDPTLPYLHVTKIAIPCHDSGAKLTNEDLLPPSLRERFADEPAMKASLGYVKLPLLANLRHKLTGAFDALYTVSRSYYPWPEAENRKNNRPESN